MEYSSSWPENLPTDQKNAIQELIQGREFANQLRLMLSEPLKDHSPLFAADLVTKILGSFKKSLFILNSGHSDEVSQVPANTRVTCDDAQKSEADSGESSKTSALKDRRGCYKRRRTSETLTRLTPTLIDDGHAWRKYGQKVILNAKYPRSYFRCTHKFDRGCQATKQVQRTENDPAAAAMYRTTYHGHHTCTINLLKVPPPPPPPQFILDSTAPRDSSSILLSFVSNDNDDVKPNHDPYFPLLKQDKYYKQNEDLTATSNFNHNTSTINQSSSSIHNDYLFSPDLFRSSEPVLSPTVSDDHGGDVISSGVYSSSCTTSTRSFEMDVMAGGVNFDDDHNHHHHRVYFEF